MSFETESRDIVAVSMGGDNAQMKEAKERERLEKEVADDILAQERRKRESLDSAERRQAISRANGLLKAQVVEIVMESNPNFDEADAKHLFDTELRKLIAIERFKAAFFGVSSAKPNFHM